MSGDIKPEYSAVAGRPCPRSIKTVAAELGRTSPRAVDVGCGFMAGTLELMRHHAYVAAVDTAVQVQRIRNQIDTCARDAAFAGFLTDDEFANSRRRFDAAYVINVLHVLPSSRRRIALLRTIREHVNDEGFIVVDVPSYEHYYAGRMTRENAYGDGYVFSHGSSYKTFYRFTTEEELDRWGRRASLAFDRKVVDNHHYVRLYRPMS